MLIADLSVDFDFFIREDPFWDFGHQEGSLFAQAVWMTRYASLDLFGETAIERWADFAPEGLVQALRAKGLRLTPGKQRRVGVADSHAHAFSFFGEDSPPDLVLNLDAHHDFFRGPSALDCGNWGTWLHDAWPETRFLQIYPRWKEAEMDGEPARAIEVAHWREWPGFGAGEVRIRNLFFCRSSAWVPPHHDARFLALARRLLGLGRGALLEEVEERSAPLPEEAEEWREGMRRAMEGLRARMEESLAEAG